MTRSAGAPQLLRLGAWTVLVLSAAFFLTTGGTYPGIASVQAHVIGQVVAIVVLGGWLALALIRPGWRPRTPLILPVLLACLAYGASALVSQRPRLSFEPTIAGLGWAFAFLFLSRLLADGWFRARVAVVMTAFVAVVAFGYIVQVGIEWVSWWSMIGRLAVPPLRPSFAALFLGSPNLIATALMLLGPLVVAIAWTRYQRPRTAIVLAIACAIAIFLSGSRGAWLGVGAGALVAIGLAATDGGTRAALRRLAATARARPIFLIPAIGTLVALVVLAPSVLLRFAQGGTTLRIDLWRSAVAIFAEHPLLGAGPGTWVQLKVEANPEGAPNVILPHAHDVYVQAAAEVGIVGLVALAVLTIAVVGRLWAAWGRRPEAGSEDQSALSIEAAAALVSLAAFAAQSVVDNLVNLPFVCLLVIVTVAWVDGRLAEFESVRTGPRPSFAWRMNAFSRGPLIPVVGLLVLAVAIPTLLRIDRAASLGLSGNDYALMGDWQLALDAYDAARREDPGFTLYEIQTASALARVGRTAEARDQLREAVELDPTAINVIGLAALEAELGDRDTALAHVARARELGIGEPLVALNAGLIAERLGDREVALNAFADAVSRNPPLASSDFWASPTRSVTTQDVMEAARARAEPLEAALILAYAGDPVEARRELETVPDSSRRAVYIAATFWLEGNTPAALARLDAILEADASNWFAAAWAARITLLFDEDSYARYSRWAIAVQGDSAPNVIREMSVIPALSDAPTVGLPGNYPWAIYLRPIAPFALMPQLASIGSR